MIQHVDRPTDEIAGGTLGGPIAKAVMEAVLNPMAEPTYATTRRRPAGDPPHGQPARSTTVTRGRVTSDVPRTAQTDSR